MKYYKLLLPALFLFSCGHVPRALWKNFPSVRDLKPEILMPAASDPGYFEMETQSFPPATNWIWRPGKKLPYSSEDAFCKSGTDAFLVIKEDSIIHEYYGKNTDRLTRFNTHSIAKSIVSTLTGIALQQGHVRSLSQPIVDILPELKGRVSEDLLIGDLLQMTSGLNFSENYLNPYSSVTSMYYSSHTENWIKKIRQKYAPGSRFAYHSSNTWLLVRVLERATGQSLSEYATAYLWHPLGVPVAAGWKTDRQGDGNILGFTGFNTTATGLARIGQLMVKGGVWQGNRLLPESWTEALYRADTIRGAVPFYQRAWYPNSYYQDYFAEGLFYQYLYCHPATGTVIVRIGDGGSGSYDWRMSFRVLAGIQEKPTHKMIEMEEVSRLSGIFMFQERSDGDTMLLGRKIKITGTNEFLKVKVLNDSDSVRVRTKGYVTDKKFRLYQDSSGYFYEPKTMRTLVYASDGNSLKWKRQEFEWYLTRVTPSDK